ncbi:MAG: hypothetical protein JXA96_17000 [Sedimentisphaerales bacterium]|nr:hypothetical protein [Sedimentisphaerales bacterium]
MSKKMVFLFVGFFIFALYLIIMPFFTKTKTTYKYQLSIGNLKQIGLGLLMYAEDHNDVFPDDLEQTEEYLGSFKYDFFQSRLKPKDFNGPTFIYISGHSFKDAESKEKYIIFYENPKYLSGYEREKIPVLYLEGYVERLKKEKFLSELRKTYGHIGKPMPEIKFKD